MDELSDIELAQRSAAGDERAFMALMRRYEQHLADLIRYQVSNTQHAEDILQETLVQAWLGLGKVRDGDKVRPWLLQVARNRIRDFFKSTQRRERPVDDPVLESHLNQFGHSLRGQKETLEEVYEALEQVPEMARGIAQQFYLQGFTIEEIAKRNRKPSGTVKRQLFEARNHIRQSLEVNDRARRPIMAKKRADNVAMPFPERRPEVVITELDEAPFVVDSPELRWWIVIPKLGDVAVTGRYIPSGWKFDGATRMQALRPAKIHGVEGVEIDVDVWDDEKGWHSAGWSMCGQQDDTMTQYLATVSRGDEIRDISTFLEEGFTASWGPMERRLEDRQRLVRQEDGSWIQAHSADNLDAFGAGVYSVRLGEREFTCLRVIQLEGELTDQQSPLDVNYVTQEGRTVLKRSYCQDCLDDIVVDKEEEMVVDGVHLFLWEDTLTGLALGA
jgi:RNA polymerase sigma-70 factor (ECF subfamily)